MTSDQINISILEDHPLIVDGYRRLLEGKPRIYIAGTTRFGEDLEPMLAAHPTDILIMDIEVPTSTKNPNPYPIINAIPRLKHRNPGMAILVISSHDQQVLVETLFDLGVRGYIFKDDPLAFDKLADILIDIHEGKFYFSQGRYEKLSSLKFEGSLPRLSSRQLEALSLCVAFPDSSSHELAQRLGVSDSTFRNLLSAAYKHLGVRTRQAAILKLQKMGIGSSDFDPDWVLNPQKTPAF